MAKALPDDAVTYQPLEVDQLWSDGHDTSGYNCDSPASMPDIEVAVLPQLDVGDIPDGRPLSISEPPEIRTVYPNGATEPGVDFRLVYYPFMTHFMLNSHVTCIEYNRGIPFVVASLYGSPYPRACTPDEQSAHASVQRPVLTLQLPTKGHTTSIKQNIDIPACKYLSALLPHVTELRVESFITSIDHPNHSTSRFIFLPQVKGSVFFFEDSGIREGAYGEIKIGDRAFPTIEFRGVWFDGIENSGGPLLSCTSIVVDRRSVVKVSRPKPYDRK